MVQGHLFRSVTTLNKLPHCSTASTIGSNPSAGRPTEESEAVPLSPICPFRSSRKKPTPGPADLINRGLKRFPLPGPRGATSSRCPQMEFEAPRCPGQLSDSMDKTNTRYLLLALSYASPYGCVCFRRYPHLCGPKGKPKGIQQFGGTLKNDAPLCMLCACRQQNTATCRNAQIIGGNTDRISSVSSGAGEGDTTKLKHGHPPMGTPSCV